MKIMVIIPKKLIFSVTDTNTIDKETLMEIAQMARELWSDFEYPHPNPSLDEYKRRLNKLYRADQKNIFILMKNKLGKSIGFCKILVNTGLKNRSISHIDFYIKLEFRRQGYFKELFLYGTKVIPDYVKLYKFKIRVDNNQKNFLENQSLDKKLTDLKEKLDGKLAFSLRRSELDLTKQTLENVSQIAKELKLRAKEKCYSFFFVDDIKFPDLPFTRSEYIKMLERIDNDIPRDDLSLEDSVLTEEDFLIWFKSEKLDKLTEWIYIAVDKNYLPIGMTETKIRASAPHLAYIGDTGVLNEHRGNKLGLTLKYLMLEKLLTDPISKDKVKYWITFNANSNKHMIAINDELGYVQSSLEYTYEFPIENLKNYFLTGISLKTKITIFENDLVQYLGKFYHLLIFQIQLVFSLQYLIMYRREK